MIVFITLVRCWKVFRLFNVNLETQKIVVKSLQASLRWFSRSQKRFEVKLILPRHQNKIIFECLRPLSLFLFRSLFHCKWSCQMQLVRTGKVWKASPWRLSQALIRRRRNFHEAKNVSVGNRRSQFSRMDYYWGGYWNASIWIHFSITREATGLVWRQAWKYSLQRCGSSWRYELKILFVVLKLTCPFSAFGFWQKIRREIHNPTQGWLELTTWAWHTLQERRNQKFLQPFLPIRPFQDGSDDSHVWFRTRTRPKHFRDRCIRQQK